MNETQKKALEMIENVMTPENLQFTVSFTSLFVLVFECFKDMVIDRPKAFFCISSMEFRDGKIVYRETEEYKNMSVYPDKEFIKIRILKNKN